MPGDEIRQRYRKFDGSPHWRFDSVYLGSDEFGRWVGGRPGDVFARPGRTFTADAHYVTLIPTAGWVATFNDPSSEVHSQIYVDVMSVPEWSGHEVRAVDLDLDVVRRFTGEVRIDDEDEFAAHLREFSYPPELIDRARRTADWLLDAIRDRQEPFGSVGMDWLSHARDLWVSG